MIFAQLSQHDTIQKKSVRSLLSSTKIQSLCPVDICDRFELKQADGRVLTNPLNATPLPPGSTFIDGFSKLIPQRIPVEISYLLVYCP